MRLIRYLLIVALVLIAIWHLKPQFGELSQIPHLIRGANYFFLFLSAIAIVGQYVGDGWLSQALLQVAGRKINLTNTVKIASIDVFAAHLLPLGEVGTIATIAYFYKKIGVTNQEMIFLTITWGIATNLVLALYLAVAAMFLPRLPNVPIHVSDFAKISLFAILVSAIMLLIFRKTFWNFAKQKLSKFSFFAEITSFFADFRSHINKVKNSKLLILKALLAALIYYMANIVSLQFAFMAFGHPPAIAVTTVAYLLSIVISFVTLAPAGIGASEATMFLIFHQFGTDTALAVAGVLAFRLFAFWLPIPAGFLSYVSLKKYKNAS